MMDWFPSSIYYDATNPKAREYVWSKCKKNYYDHGIKIFWLDEAEPEYDVYDFDNYRYAMGPNVQIGNIYPQHYSRTFYDGMQAEGQDNIVNLVRCAWAGSQRYGALVWSGDIDFLLKISENKSLPAFIWEWQEYLGGQRILEALEAVIQTIPNSVNC